MSVIPETTGPVPLPADPPRCSCGAPLVEAILSFWICEGNPQHVFILMPGLIMHPVPGECRTFVLPLARAVVELRSQRDEARGACREVLRAIDECYEATGCIRVVKTSEQRLKIEKALAGEGGANG